MATLPRSVGGSDSSPAPRRSVNTSENPGQSMLSLGPRSDGVDPEQPDSLEQPLLQRTCPPEGEKIRNVVGFWLLGFLTNVTYVVNNAGAGDIVPGNYALIYVCGVLPSFLIKLTAPYWFHRVPYRVRITIAGVCAGLNFALVMYGPTPGIQLLGVALAAVQGGIGEATGLALSQFYREPKRCLVMWSSGTGFAGPGGYIISLYVLAPLPTYGRLIFGECIAVCYLLTFFFVLEPPWIDAVRGPQPLRRARQSPQASPAASPQTQPAAGPSISDAPLEAVPATEKMGARERFRRTLSLWPYLVPLFLVYWSEYAIEAGTWTAIAFDPTKVAMHSARDEAYRELNFLYQWGVFVSRSSGRLLSANRGMLWLMPALQCGMLAFFYLDAMHQFWSGWSLLAPAFATGLLGGAVYVNAFTLIDREVEKAYREFALTTASVADSIGIISADVSSMWLQACLYKSLGFPEQADMTC